MNLLTGILYWSIVIGAMFGLAIAFGVCVLFSAVKAYLTGFFGAMFDDLFGPKR